MRSLQSEQLQYVIILISVIGVIFLGHMIYANINQSKEIEIVKHDNSGEIQSDIIMYGSESCPWCTRQKEELGNLWDTVKYINCEENPDMCGAVEVNALPTWVIKNSKSEGFMKKDEFIKKCNL